MVVDVEVQLRGKMEVDREEDYTAWVFDKAKPNWRTSKIKYRKQVAYSKKKCANWIVGGPWPNSTKRQRPQR